MTTHDSTLLRIAHGLDRISLASGHITAWLVLPMVLSLTYEVARATSSTRRPNGPTT